MSKIESTLQEKIKKIFDLKSVSFDSPSESQEQEKAFIEVEETNVKVVDKIQTARVTGVITIFAHSGKMPMDYLATKLALARAEDKANLSFFDIGLSKGRLQNIDERTVRFVYFYSGQYDPNLGTLNDVDITVNEVN
jgi:hypothetical protein